MADNLGIRKRKPEVGASVETPKTKKRVKIGDAEVFDYEVDNGEVDDTEYLETVKPRRGAVKLDGYDSASSDSEDDAILNPAAEDDMFGDDLPKDDRKKKSKNPRFVSSEEIEGQEWEHGGMDYEDEDGIKITPFNVREELEEGNYDENGNYIRAKDEHRLHDRWLQGLTSDEIAKARAAKDRHEERLRHIASQEERIADDPHQIWLKMLEMMKPKETVPSALRRLAGNQGKPNRNRWKKNKKAAAEDTMDATEDPSLKEERRRHVEELTAFADRLMSMGSLDVYSMTYEQVVRMLRSSEVLPDDWLPPTE
ncbi:hypothetical protein BC832DRAFT_593437 [Gaertneriomyces semiglobifer]|nr:hypothetical protein BC832DRAFT_593437 [Gaertneriomyces semiglobifer]